ncbi:hypothetical protein [Ornithinimicrobium kibberense]|uniref:hypothetical protein n=1 Tax=Ornithinimicrobium kibberense TaxID=282060 RepID=UPI003619E311
MSRPPDWGSDEEPLASRRRGTCPVPLAHRLRWRGRRGPGRRGDLGLDGGGDRRRVRRRPGSGRLRGRGHGR